jgi:ketosteroid isomerase-like protein
MKKLNWIAVATLFILSFAVCASESDAQPEQPEKQIRACIDAQVAAWNRGDLNGFMRCYWRSPKLTFFSGGTITTGFEPTLARYQKKYQGEGKGMGKLDFSDLSVTMLGPGAAFVRGRWHLKMSDGKEPHGLFTLIWQLHPSGVWQIIHDHTSTE